MSLWAENLLDSRKFWSIFYLQNATYFHIPFSLYYYYALSNSYDVITPLNNCIVEYSFLFTLLQKCKTPPRNMRVIVKNKAACFYSPRSI